MPLSWFTYSFFKNTSVNTSGLPFLRTCMPEQDGRKKIDFHIILISVATSIFLVGQVKICGVIFDSCLSSTYHIQSISKSCWFSSKKNLHLTTFYHLYWCWSNPSHLWIIIIPLWVSRFPASCIIFYYSSSYSVPKSHTNLFLILRISRYKPGPLF